MRSQLIKAAPYLTGCICLVLGIFFLELRPESFLGEISVKVESLWTFCQKTAASYFGLQEGMVIEPGEYPFLETVVFLAVSISAAVCVSLCCTPVWIVLAGGCGIALAVCFNLFMVIRFQVVIPLMVPMLCSLLACGIILLLKGEGDFTWSDKKNFAPWQLKGLSRFLTMAISTGYAGQMLALVRNGGLPISGAAEEITILEVNIRKADLFEEYEKERITEKVRQEGLNQDEQEKLENQSFQHILRAVNDYWAVIIPVIRERGGIICHLESKRLFAWWSSSLIGKNHANRAVLSGVELQKKVFDLNRCRQYENHKIELENAESIAIGREQKDLLAFLTISVSLCTLKTRVGLVGDCSYAAYGPDRGVFDGVKGLAEKTPVERIFMSESTYEEITRQMPEWKEICKEEPEKWKCSFLGKEEQVKVYTLAWKSREMEIEEWKRKWELL